jgi:hypothetical protein
MHIGVLSFSILAVHALAAVFFTYLQGIRPQRYLQVWAIGWYVLVAHDVTIGLTYRLGTSPLGVSGWLMLIDRFLLAASGVAFFCAARLYMNARAWPSAAWLMAAGLDCMPFPPALKIYGLLGRSG